MPTLEFDIANPSRDMESGSTLQEPTQKSMYQAWTEGAQSQLFQWLEVPKKYKKWKCVGVKSSNRSIGGLGLTKKVETKLISKYFNM